MSDPSNRITLPDLDPIETKFRLMTEERDKWRDRCSRMRLALIGITQRLESLQTIVNKALDDEQGM